MIHFYKLVSRTLGTRSAARRRRRSVPDDPFDAWLQAVVELLVEPVVDLIRVAVRLLHSATGNGLASTEVGGADPATASGG